MPNFLLSVFAEIEKKRIMKKRYFSDYQNPNSKYLHLWVKIQFC